MADSQKKNRGDNLPTLFENRGSGTDVARRDAGRIAVREQARDLALPMITGTVAVSVLVWWFTSTSGGDVAGRLPGLDALPASLAESPDVAEPVAAGTAVAGPGLPSELSGHWPGFRGPNRDGIARESVRLARSWPDDGPPVLWSILLGEGYAGAAISHGCAYVLDYDAEAAADTLRCLSMDDGREIWRNGYPVQLTRNHGMSRTVPVVVDDRVITIGPRCHVACWDAHTGECHWLMDLELDYGVTVPRWYTGQCPLVDNGHLILAPCGESLLMAVDCESGSVVWESENPRDWEMSHSSIMPMDFEGQRSYIYCGSGGASPQWRLTTDGCSGTRPIGLPSLPHVPHRSCCQVAGFSFAAVMAEASVACSFK